MNLVYDYKSDEEQTFHCYSVYEVSYDEKHLNKIEKKYPQKKHKPVFREIRKQLLRQVFADEHRQDTEKSVYLRVARSKFSYYKKALKAMGMEAIDATETVSASWSKEHTKNFKKSKRMIIGLAVASKRRKKK